MKVIITLDELGPVDCSGNELSFDLLDSEEVSDNMTRISAELRVRFVERPVAVTRKKTTRRKRRKSR